MSKGADAEFARVAGSFRARARRIVFTVIINVTLAATCLGAPYVRGRMRAQESRLRFGQFAACMLDGKASAKPGLTMPAGATKRFAARYMADDPDWPKRCLPALEAVAPEQAIFLWPAVKQADEDVRATVQLTRRELDTMADERGDSDDVPVRPLLAIQKIVAALTLQAKAAGNDWELDGRAITLPRDGQTPQPASLPLGTGDGASLDMWTHDDGLDALSVDRAGITWMRVAQGELDRSRLRRTSLVRGSLLQDGQPWILWATPEDRCAEREDRCVRRATGIARYELGARKLPVPTWLAGHPAGSLQRSVRVRGDRMWLLARRDAEGSVEVREFTLPKKVADEAKPQSPTRSYGAPGPVGGGATLLSGEPPAIYIVEPSTSGLQPKIVNPDGLTHALSAIGNESPWAVSCTAGSRTWIAHGDAYSLRIGHFVGSEPPQEVTRAQVKLRSTGTGADRAGDAVRLHCDASGVHALYLDSKLVLRQTRCNADGCGKGSMLLRNVLYFTAAGARDNALLVAVSGGRNHKRVKTLRIESNGDASRPMIAGACWQDGDGMCGAPTLLADGDRTLLATRGGGSLNVLQTRDGGDSWQTMSGLKMGNAMTEGTHAPLEQHRIRKGMR